MSCLATKDLTITRGASWSLCVTVGGAGCELEDLTGQAIYFSVRDNSGATDPLILKTTAVITEIEILDQTTDEGKFKLYLQPSDTFNISPGCYTYDIWREDTTGERHIVIPPSKFLVEHSVTNIGAPGSPPSILFPEAPCLSVVGPFTSGRIAGETDDVILADTSAGGFTVNLPPHPLTCPEGKSVTVRELTGSEGLMVSPISPDTLDGLLTPVEVPAGGSLTFTSDGSNWNITSDYNPNTSDSTGLIVDFTYEPGGTGAGPAVFSDWTAMYAAMQATRLAAGGPITLRVTIDDRVTSPAVVPAGTYDMANVQLYGVIRPGGFGASEARIGEGVFWQNGPRFFNSIRLQTTATTTIPMVVENADTVVFTAFCDVSCTGGADMFDTSALGPGSYYTATFYDGGFAGGAGRNGSVFALGDNTILLLQGFHGRLNRDTISGGPGSGVFQQVYPGWQYTQNQANFNGFAFLADWTLTLPRVKVNPTVNTSTTTIFSQDSVIYSDVSGGAFTLNLPSMDFRDAMQGRIIWIREVSGTDGLIIGTPDTALINGAVTFTFPAGKRSMGFVADGTNWITLGD